MLAEHYLAVLELQRIRMSRLGDGMDLGAFGKIRKDGMEIGITEVAQISDSQAKTGQRIGHDRAIASEFGEAADQLDIGAFVRCRPEAFRQLRNRRQSLKGFRAVAL